MWFSPSNRMLHFRWTILFVQLGLRDQWLWSCVRSSLLAQVFCYISNLKEITWNFNLSWIHLRSVEVTFCHPGTAAALTEPVSIRKRWSSQRDMIICSIPSLGALITPLLQGEMMLSFPWTLPKRVLPTHHNIHTETIPRIKEIWAFIKQGTCKRTPN